MRRLVRDLASSRYAALTLLMVVIAVVCVVAGTWQVFRYDGKHLANDDLRANARDAPAPVASVLPLVGAGAAPGQDAIEFRPVTATGVYDLDDQLLVRRQQVDDRNGYFVLTPLRTTAGPVLLVVRGFVADTTLDRAPTDVPTPPAGTVTVTARTQASDTGDDKFRALGNGQVDLVNATSAADRLGTDVYAGYAELEGGQAGTAGLTAIPAPDLSNPAGGAFELQHLAYIVQWYLFAGLALAAPVVMVRTDRKRAADDAAAREQEAERNRAQRKPGADLLPVNPSRPRAPSAEERLAERYGR
ncbi:SURF1 family protein [Jatrophihabitans sp. YIM 134969]